MLLKSFTAFLFATAALAVPLDFGIHFGSGSDKMPTLTLPYASYKAYSYDVTDDVSTYTGWGEDKICVDSKLWIQYYVFKNIRFAAPPTGERRWKKPAPPLTETGVQDGSVGYQCNQALNALLSCMFIFLRGLFKNVIQLTVI